MIFLICGILKNGTNECIYKTGIESQIEKTNLWLPERKWINWETGIDTCTTIHKINKDLSYSTGHSTQYSVMTYMGKESKKTVDLCICITDSLCCILETNTTLPINYTSIMIKKKTWTTKCNV